MIKSFLLTILKFLLPEVYKRRRVNQPIFLKHYVMQKILFFNSSCYWPVDWRSTVIGSKYILVGIGSAPGYSFGCYIVASEKSPITIGNYTIIAPNVILPGRNHNVYNYRQHEDGGINIGNYCWIGANSVILPNVMLGDHVVVGAGSVVTKSFENGHVIIAGNPAKIIKYLNKSKCAEIKDKYQYHGYIKKENFNSYRKKNLKI